MNDFNFYNPTRILFGKEKETLIGRELQQAGISSVLLIYGSGSIKKSGLYERLITSLADSGITATEHPGVVSNPLLSHAREGVALAKKTKVQAILAVGGGSVLDEAKAIAAGALCDHDVWEFYTGRPVETALPLYTILTIAASASEMNGNSVLTNEATHQKYSFNSLHAYPKLSVMNPELMASVPADYTAYSAVDAIAHVIEAYFTHQNKTPLQDRFAESIIKTVIETTDAIMKDPDDYEARANFAWSATMALNGLTTSGAEGYTFPNHMIEHSLSALFNIAHGAGLAIVIPAWMRWYMNKNPQQFRRFAKEVFNLESGEAGVDALEAWFRKIGAPVRLSETGIPADAVDAVAANAARTAQAWGFGEIYAQRVIREILEEAR